MDAESARSDGPIPRRTRIERPVQARSSRSSAKARCSRRIVVLFMTMIAALPASIERST
jgi:hypothetical protein